jgi:hypothetical protein
MGSMVIDDFILSDVGEIRVRDARIHILHHLMDNIFLLEAFLD